MTTHDYERLLWEESADLADLLDELPDDAFDVQSLCAAWRVRDVVSHMIVGHTTSMPSMLAAIARYRGNITRASALLSRDYGSSHPPAQIRSEWRALTANRTLRGISRVIIKRDGFVDHLTHHQDIRRPLERPRVIPPERLLAALDALPKIGPPVGAKRRMTGLRWQATDVGWTWGSGPLVEGPAEALIVVATGRPAALADLTGDGLEVLTSRV